MELIGKSNRIFKKITGKVNVDVILKIFMVVILLYYFLGLLSYATVPIKPIYRLFTSSSSVAVIVRAFMTGLICVYSILLLIYKKIKVNWKFLCIFCFVLFCTLVGAIISPMSYKYIYVHSLYKTVYHINLTATYSRTLSLYLSSISDFALAFCFMFVLPYAVKDKKQLLWLLVPIVILGVMECAYSLIKEKDIYIYLLKNSTNEFGGYDVRICATFDSKEEFGSFLTLSLVCSVGTIFLMNKQKKFSIFIIMLLLFCCCLFFLISVLSLCKTSILGSGLFLFICFIWLWFYCVKKNKYLAILSTIFGLLVIGGFCLFFFVPQFHQTGLLNKIYNYLYNFIFKRADSAVSSRTDLWMQYVENVRGYNFLFGMSKSLISPYVTSLQPQNNPGIHNGIAYFFASYGLIGFFVYIILFFIVLRRIFKLWKINFNYVFFFIGSLFACTAFVLAEGEVLIVSGSNLIFPYNVIIVIFSCGVYLVEEKNYVEVNK